MNERFFAKVSQAGFRDDAGSERWTALGAKHAQCTSTATVTYNDGHVERWWCVTIWAKSDQDGQWRILTDSFGAAK